MRLLNFAAALFLLLTTAVLADENGGSVAGTVRLTGSPPAIPLRYAEEDLDTCGAQARPAQVLALGTNQTVRGAIVYLANVSSKETARTEPSPVVLTVRRCEFEPRVQIGRSSAEFVVRNNDPVLHVMSVDALSGTNGPVHLLDLAAPYAGFEQRFALANFREPTLLRISSSNGHNWMTAYVAVMPHPWAVLTDENGRFALGPLTVGTYKLCVWHEALGTLVREVKVAAGRSVSVDFEFSARTAAAKRDETKRSD